MSFLPPRELREGAVHHRFVDPPKINVGPFLVNQVSDFTLGNVVGRDKIPVILYDSRYKVIDGEEVLQEKYAVMVPPSKDVGLVCAGCYNKERGNLFNNSQCVSCRTFSNHTDMIPIKNEFNDECVQVRKKRCLNDNKPNSLESIMNNVANDIVDDDNDIKDLKDVPNCDLLEELASRHEDGLAGFLDHIGEAKLIDHLKTRNPNLLLKLPCEPMEPYCVGAPWDMLEAEMRRLAYGPDVTKKRFYAGKKKRGLPHYTDKPVVTWEYVHSKVNEI